MRAFLLSKVHLPHLGFASAGVAPLPPRFRNFLNEAISQFLFVTEPLHVEVTGVICRTLPSMQSPKMVMGVDKGVHYTHNNDPVLEDSWRAFSDEGLKQVASARKNCSSPPSSGDQVEERDIRCNVRESQVRHDLHLYIFVLHHRCVLVVPYTCRCKEREECQRLIQGEKHVLHFSSQVKFVP